MSRETPFLVKGIVSVLQTPFDWQNLIDWQSYERLIEDAISSEGNGFLTPAVASEVIHLTTEEREQIIRFVVSRTKGQVPLIVGASGTTIDQCRHFAQLAETVGADAYLVAIIPELYRQPDRLVPFFQAVASQTRLPLIIQDLQFDVPGLCLDLVKQLVDGLPTLAGMKIETVPAGPKYTDIRHAYGSDFFIAGGWAVPQMLEALDRGVDAMIPESSMVRVYSKIFRAYTSGNREHAKHLFWYLLPILSFANQDLETSITFFKRLLVRKRIFRTATMRYSYIFDAYQERIADELIDRYLEIEAEENGI